MQRHTKLFCWAGGLGVASFAARYLVPGDDPHTILAILSSLGFLATCLTVLLAVGSYLGYTFWDVRWIKDPHILSVRLLFSCCAVVLYLVFDILTNNEDIDWLPTVLFIILLASIILFFISFVLEVERQRNLRRPP